MPRYGTTAGAPPADLDAGVYRVRLIGFEDRQMRRGERFCDAKKGQSPDDILPRVVWKFLTVGSNEPLEILTSPSCAEKSAFFKLATALNGGIPPCKPADSSYDWEELLGREAQAQVTPNERNFPRIVNLMALPRGADADEIPF